MYTTKLGRPLAPACASWWGSNGGQKGPCGVSQGAAVGIGRAKQQTDRLPRPFGAVMNTAVFTYLPLSVPLDSLLPWSIAQR